MSYPAVVLSKNPFLYLRLDELSGTTAADASGNGYDGTYFAEALLGQTSPIETDASSRAVKNRVCKVLTAPAPVNSFSWAGWILYSEDLFIAGGLVCRDGQIGSNGSNFLGVDAGSARAMISTEGTNETTFGLSWPLPAFGWYRLCVTRHLNVMKLRVNGVLRALREDLPTGPITSASFLNGGGGNGWKVGVTGDTGNVWQSVGTDEVDLYDYPLPDADDLEIYEAALLNPPVFLRADLHLNAYISGDFAAPPALLPFRPNWEAPIKETLSWLTDVLPARQDYEQRAAVRMRPRRSLEYDFTLLDNTERRLFKAFLFANKKRAIYIPIVTDEVSLTADAPASSSALDFVSTNFDFNDDGALAVYKDERTFEVATIDTVGASSTSLTAPTSESWTVQTARVIPLARAIAETPIRINRVTDSIEEATVRFQILPEDVPLAPHRLGTYSPRYTLNGVEVFDPFVLGPNNWEEDGKGSVSIRATDAESVAGIFSRTPWDTAPREITSYSFFLDGRDEIAMFLAWWWNMEGRTKPIWVPTLQEDFKFVSATTGQIVVEDHEQTELYLWHESRRDLAIVYTDETMAFRRITSAQASGSNDVLFLNADVSPTNLWFVSFLKLSRLNEDTIDLVWHTDQLVEVTLNFIDEKPTDDQ